MRRQPQPPAPFLRAKCVHPQQSCQHPALHRAVAESRDPGLRPAASTAIGFAQSHRHPAPCRVSSGARRTADDSLNGGMCSKVRRLKKTNPSFSCTPKSLGSARHQPH